MDLGAALRFVTVRAQAEADFSGWTEIYPEHIFLGILKLPELSVQDFFRAFADKGDIEADIRAVKLQLEQRGIQTGDGRQRMRRALKMSAPPGEGGGAVAKLLAEASQLAKGDRISASDVLSILLRKPTPIIRALFFDAEEAAKPPKKSTSIEKLAELTNRVTEMQYTLLKSVRGQDHAIRAFADGIFNAELLADANDRRSQPKAIFLFAGPPGVGKTFLSELAAESLALPFKRFDMSSFSDHQSHCNLIGMNPSYQAAKPGTLTGFVKDNANCILLFDEIEKAHLNTIQLFFQILDAGVLHDDNLDQNVSFKDTVIIFTTNAGRQLYETGKSTQGVSRQTILDALGADKDPRTGNPFFPPAICSRLGTGYPILFNHLRTYDLMAIVQGELARMSALYKQMYGVRVKIDDRLPSIILFSEGGFVDARTLRAQTELFFKNEILKLCRLWGPDKLAEAFGQIREITFRVDGNTSEDLKPLFENPDKPAILFFGKSPISDVLAGNLSGYAIQTASDVDTVMRLAGENDFLFVLVEVSTVGERRPGDSYGLFERVPIASSSLRQVNELLSAIRERLPELPVYLLDTGKPGIDSELEAAFIQKGARGKLDYPADRFDVFVDEMDRISSQLYLQGIAATFAAESKRLAFVTAPKLSADKSEAIMRLREFEVHRAVRGSDRGSILDDAEKPDVRFSDVIGAKDAKDELQFFVQYLKNPKMLRAQGLKPPKGVLLYGPPGTGKTLLAKALAGESGVTYIPAVGSGFVTKWQGSGSEAIRELFARARRYAPTIIFIDEIDAIGRARSGSGSGHGEEMALNALLSEMDGFSVDSKRPVFVLAATNYDVEEGKGGMGVIDAALARRFERRILVDLPDEADRKQYLERMISRQSSHGVTLKMIARLASRSTGLSLANLASVLELAKRTAIKENTAVNDALLEEAFEMTLHGEKRDWGREYLERVARHEAGHAYMCYSAGTVPDYLTIVSRGDHGGYMQDASIGKTPILTKDELLARIRTSLGGRAAEIAYYGARAGLSSGASGDLKSAAQIARVIVCDYAMDDEMGLAALIPKEAWQGAYAEKIHMRISDLLNGLLKETIQAVSEGVEKIDMLVEQLLEKNKLSGNEIESILGG